MGVKIYLQFFFACPSTCKKGLKVICSYFVKFYFQFFFFILWLFIFLGFSHTIFFLILVIYFVRKVRILLKILFLLLLCFLFFLYFEIYMVFYYYNVFLLGIEFYSLIVITVIINTININVDP